MWNIFRKWYSVIIKVKRYLCKKYRKCGQVSLMEFIKIIAIFPIELNINDNINQELTKMHKKSTRFKKYGIKSLWNPN